MLIFEPFFCLVGAVDLDPLLECMKILVKYVFFSENGLIPMEFLYSKWGFRLEKLQYDGLLLAYAYEQTYLLYMSLCICTQQIDLLLADAELRQ